MSGSGESGKDKGKDKARGDPYLDKDGKTWLTPEGIPYRPDQFNQMKIVDLSFKSTQEEKENMTQEEMAKLYHQNQPSTTSTISNNNNNNNNQEDDKIELLTEDGDLTESLVNILIQIFLQFAITSKKHVDIQRKKIDSKLSLLYWTEEELDEFSKIVNDDFQILDEAAKAEIKEYLDVDKDGNLTVSVDFTSFTLFRLSLYLQD